MKPSFLTICAAILLLAISACNVNNEPENLSPSDYTPVKISSQYQVSLPNYLKKTDDLNDDASLQYMNGLRETYAIVIDEVKDGFALNVEFYEGYDSTRTVLESYTKIQMESFESIMAPDPEIVSKTTKINGVNAELVQFTGELEGIKIRYHIGFFESDDHLYVMMLWTLDDRNIRYGETFQTVLKSFKVL